MDTSVPASRVWKRLIETANAIASGMGWGQLSVEMNPFLAVTDTIIIIIIVIGTTTLSQLNFDYFSLRGNKRRDRTVLFVLASCIANIGVTVRADP